MSSITTGIRHKVSTMQEIETLLATTDGRQGSREGGEGEREAGRQEREKEGRGGGEAGRQEGRRKDGRRHKVTTRCYLSQDVSRDDFQDVCVSRPVHGPTGLGGGRGGGGRQGESTHPDQLVGETHTSIQHSPHTRGGVILDDKGCFWFHRRSYTLASLLSPLPPSLDLTHVAVCRFRSDRSDDERRRRQRGLFPHSHGADCWLRLRAK